MLLPEVRILLYLMLVEEVLPLEQLGLLVAVAEAAVEPLAAGEM